MEAILDDPERSGDQRQQANRILGEIAAEADLTTVQEPAGPADSGDTAWHRRSIAALHRRIADQLHPPEPEVSVAVNADWIDAAMSRAGVPTGEYDTTAILLELADLWDHDHLQKRAQELIEYAHQRSQGRD